MQRAVQKMHRPSPCLKNADFSSADIICKQLGPGPDQTKWRVVLGQTAGHCDGFLKDLL